MKAYYRDNRFFLNFLMAWTLLFIALRTLQHYSFQTNAYDLSIFDYMMSFTLEGDFMAEPFHGYWGSHFAIHFNPILVFILPLYLLLKGPVFLLFIQVFSGAMSALVLYSILKKEFPQNSLPALISISYLIYRPFLNGIMYDFHPEMFFPLFLFLSYYFVAVKKNYPLYFCSIAMALFIKEDVSIFIFGYGLFLFFKLKENRKIGLVTSASAFVYFLMTMELIIPYFREQLEMTTKFEFLSLWKDYGDNAFEIIKTLITNPLIVFKSISWEEVLPNFFNLVAPLLLIPFLSLFVLLIIPPVFILATSQSSVMQGFGLHYISGILPFLFLALIYGFKNIEKFLARRKKSAKLLLYLAVAILVVNLANTKWNLLKPHSYPALKDYKIVKEYIRLIPPDASVAALSSLIPHIPKRKNISMLPKMVEAQYVLIHSGINLWPFEAHEFEEFLSELSTNSTYTCVRSTDGIRLYKKIH